MPNTAPFIPETLPFLAVLQGPGELIMAKPSDEADRIEYLLAAGQVAEALALAEHHRGR